jgi:hypothetical protein
VPCQCNRWNDWREGLFPAPLCVTRAPAPVCNYLCRAIIRLPSVATTFLVRGKQAFLHFLCDHSCFTCTCGFVALRRRTQVAAATRRRGSHSPLTPHGLSTRRLRTATAGTRSCLTLVRAWLLRRAVVQVVKPLRRPLGVQAFCTQTLVPTIPSWPSCTSPTR